MMSQQKRNGSWVRHILSLLLAVSLTIYVLTFVATSLRLPMLTGDCPESNRVRATFNAFSQSQSGLLQNLDASQAVEVFRTFLLNPPVPASVPYPSSVTSQTWFSQVEQDKAIDALLQQQTNGFFIEVGAYDGISLSNSLFFEKSRNWTGLLIEANPRAYRELLAADRKAWTTPACISLSSAVELGVDFLAHGMVGGYGVDRFQEGGHLQKAAETSAYVYRVKANCFPLNVMLDAIGANRVDMFSLDVEGAELAVLKSIDWNRVTIRVLMIEHNGQPKQIDEFLVSKGYQLVNAIDGYPGAQWKKSDVLYVLKSEFPTTAH